MKKAKDDYKDGYGILLTIRDIEKFKKKFNRHFNDIPLAKHRKCILDYIDKELFYHEIVEDNIKKTLLVRILDTKQEEESKKTRAKLKIGQKVKVVPTWTNMDLPKPKEKTMYVRELKEGNCAGLSHTKTSEHIYGILYGIIKPFK